MKQRYVTKKSKAAGGKVTCLLGFFCLMAIPVWAQDQGFHLVDDVEITLEVPGQKDTVCKLKFLEDWFIDPQANSIQKQVVRWDSCCIEILSSLPTKNGAIPIGNISCEFHLLDPHLVASRNKAFPEPDSLDGPTRLLQDQLIALVIARSDADKRYNLPEQLLSVIFEEAWSLDPENLQFSKRVHALTPVIWQRRQTEAGDPVNEAETGLPVYYKNELQQIILRNP